MAPRKTLHLTLIVFSLVFSAAVLLMERSVDATSLQRQRHDPLGLRHWVNDKPLPRYTIRRSKPEAAAAAAVMLVTAPTPRQQTLAAQRRRLQPIRESALTVRPGPPATSAINDWVSISLDASSRGLTIPSTFLGISHEWTNIEELNHGGTYQQLLQDLTAYGGGPLVVRVGGGSTDKQTAPAPSSVFASLTALHKATGMLFILGLNFRSGDITLARSQMDAIKANMPPESLLSLELGNEPNFYENVNGRSTQDYLNCCLVNDWALFAKQLCCRGNYTTCVHQQLAGPAWGHVRMWPRTLDWWLRFNNFWVNLVTVHWYQANRESASTVEHLLDERPIREEMNNLRELVQISNRYSRPLRVAEMNSISNSGRQGISNSLAAALWTLDGAFEVAAIGAVGINLHWGDGLSLYAALLRQSSGTSIVKPPYYAYLLFQMALGSGASFIAGSKVRAASGSLIKIWPLVDNKSGTVRVVLINKHTSKASGVAIQLAQADKYQNGKLIRLLGKRGLSEEWGVSLGNMTYKIGGSSSGEPAGELIKKEPAGVSRITLEEAEGASIEAGPAQQDQGTASAMDEQQDQAPAGLSDTSAGRGEAAAGNSSQERGGVSEWKYTVVMPPGSAALLVIPRTGRK